jgi:hypothetical protein
MLAMHLLSPRTVRRELVRILYIAGAVPCLNEYLVDLWENPDNKAIRLEFDFQSLAISEEDLAMCLDDLSRKLHDHFIPIPSFNAALARNINTMHSL